LHRVAVFVDAVYLFHQSGLVLSGARPERADVLLDVANVIAELKREAMARAPDSSFLRIYWYDLAHPGARLTSDQALLANSDDVKLRLCSSSLLGTARGLATAIATDLTDLVENGVLDDMVLVSGDEDLRIPVHVAQSHGVRAHLISITASRPALATPLSQEADTTGAWIHDTIESFISLRRGNLQDISSLSPGFALGHEDAGVRLEAAAKEFADALDDNDLDALDAYWATSRGVPSELDRRLLPFARNALGRDLDQAEKRLVRTCFQREVMIRFEQEESQ
jgi:uncharacterized LabA/DUF88 family protein